MSHVTVVNRSQLFAAATAISALGFLTVPAPAQAGPMLPLAPPCNQYVFTGNFSLRQSNGYQVFFSSTGPTASGNAVAVGDGGDKLQGHVSGNITGRSVNIAIAWITAPGGNGNYTGDVGDDALVHGGATYGDTSWDAFTGTTKWDSTSPLGCSTPAAPPPPPAAPPAPPVLVPFTVAPLSPPGPPAQAVATVTSDVDVYDAPGGNGNKIGILRSGRQVKLVGSCKPNDWCDVVIPELPAGSGWVWDQFLKF
jgi:hypothetical protein